MVKTIILDFGGVLGSDSDLWNSYAREILKITGLSARQLNKIFDLHWPDLKEGRKDTSSFWDEVYKKSKNNIPRGTLEKLYASCVKINKPVLQLAKNLKEKGFDLAILTNESREWMNFKIKKFQLNEIFNKIYCSAFIGVVKPNIKAFKYVLKNLNISPSEVIFIDNQENNVFTARKLGIKSILFKNVKLLKEELSLLGITE